MSCSELNSLIGYMYYSPITDHQGVMPCWFSKVVPFINIPSVAFTIFNIFVINLAKLMLQPNWLSSMLFGWSFCNMHIYIYKCSVKKNAFENISWALLQCNTMLQVLMGKGIITTETCEWLCLSFHQPIYHLQYGTVIIVLFHSNFSSSGEQPEHRRLAHEL